MEQSNKHTDIEGFLCPRASYRGQLTPQQLVFNANLQEFSHKVSYIASLQTGGKLTTNEAYERIKALWKQLKRSKKELGIGNELLHIQPDLPDES
jgi:sigma54-dependent transcription regulator